jgi:hypothetical protein
MLYTKKGTSVRFASKWVEPAKRGKIRRVHEPKGGEKVDRRRRTPVPWITDLSFQGSRRPHERKIARLRHKPRRYLESAAQRPVADCALAVKTKSRRSYVQTSKRDGEGG